MSGTQNSKLKAGQRVLVKHLHKTGVVVSRGIEGNQKNYGRLNAIGSRGYKIKLENGEEHFLARWDLKTIK